MSSQNQRQQKEVFESLGEHLLRRHRQNLANRGTSGQVIPDAAVLRLGRYLRAARVNSGLSRGELARRTGLAAGTILALEQGMITAEEVKPVWLTRLSRVLDEDTSTFALLLGCQPVPAANQWKLKSALSAWFSSRRLPAPAYAIVPATLLCILLGVTLLFGVELPYYPSDQPQTLPDGTGTAEANVSVPAVSYRFVESVSIAPEERLSLLRAERTKIANLQEHPADPTVLPRQPGVVEGHAVNRAFLLSKLETILANQAFEEPIVQSDFVLLASSNPQLEGRPNITGAEFRLENQILVLPKIININTEVRQNMIKAETQL